MLAESKAAEPPPGLRAPARTVSPRQDCGSAAGPLQLALSSGLLPSWCCATAFPTLHGLDAARLGVCGL